jgi:hypothetical protein
VTNELGELAEEDEEYQEDETAVNEEGEELEEEDFTFLDDELEAPAEPMDGLEQLIEIPRSERTYSNETQKSEAYSDLLSLNSIALQKLPETQRATRVPTSSLYFTCRRRWISCWYKTNQYSDSRRCLGHTADVTKSMCCRY